MIKDVMILLIIEMKKIIVDYHAYWETLICKGTSVKSWKTIGLFLSDFDTALSNPTVFNHQWCNTAGLP